MAKLKGHERQQKIKSRVISSSDSDKASISKMPILNTVLTVVCIGVAIWFSYKGYLETRVNTPYNVEKLVNAAKLNNSERYWGSYRSGVYFGMKTRDPYSLVTGLMWYFPQFLRQGGDGLRHWCEQGDKLDRYAWLEHDGETFGVQEIVDGGAILRTSFIKRPGGKHGGDWSARIGVSSEKDERDGEEISFIFYTAIEDKTNGKIRAVLGDSQRLTGMEGNTEGLGFFSINLNSLKGLVEEHSFLVTVAPGLHVLKETVLQNFRIATQKGSNKKHIVLGGEQLSSAHDGSKLNPNFVATQVTAKIPFEFEISFESASFNNRSEKLIGERYQKALSERRKIFNEKFEKVFHLAAKGYKEDEVNFAKMAFSNMMGSIGYFYGSAHVKSAYTKEPVPYWKAALYTAVPSRSFFPRGFLWDEGFHGLLISAWNLNIHMDIMSHWFDLMNIEGWIPREMILGQEALVKVPEEFVTQVNTNANPPTFFLTLKFILDHNREELLKKYYNLLEKLYPRLQAWFTWFNTTQIGDMPGTYRWRGRNSTTNRELNPKTLTSGLDDYPRASHPNLDERHIDLRCWIALAANVMSQIADILHKPSEKYLDTYNYLTDNDLLNHLHWSPRTQTFADYGLHTDKVSLKKPTPSPRSHQSLEMTRIVLEDPVLRFVDTTFGYVSLFPFILQIIEPNSSQLGKILDDIVNPDLLWTKYGLRSLAKNSPLYMKYNTEHSAPYWRGAIWMNINYLTAKALNHYSKIQGPHQLKAKNIYTNLRQNLIENVILQWKKTGFLWENYDDTYGSGKGCHPFTGWTSLTVLLMSEIY